jgi:hypothetical protein
MTGMERTASQLSLREAKRRSNPCFHSRRKLI